MHLFGTLLANSPQQAKPIMSRVENNHTFFGGQVPLTNAFCELSLLLLTSYSQGVERVLQGESYLRSHDTTVIFIFLPPFFFSWGACNEKPLPPFYRWCQNKYPAITALFLLSYTSSFIHRTKCRGDVSKMMRLVVCERDREKGSEAAFSSDCSRLIFVPTKLVAQPHRSGSQWKAPPAGHVLWSHAVP